MKILSIESDYGKGAVALLLVLLLTALGTTQTGRGNEIQDEEYTVFSAALEHLCSGGYKTEFGSALVLLAHTDRSYPRGLAETLHRLSQQPDIPTPKSLRPSDPRVVRKREELTFKAEVSGDAVLDWSAKNVDSYQLANKFHLSAPVVIPSQADWAELNDLKKEKGIGPFYEAFRAKYRGSNAIIWVSRVGFNKESSQAVVEVDYVTGEEGGEGVYLLLAKENGTWRVHHVITAWMS